MLFDIATLKDDTSAAAVTQAILARDPTAQITVRLADRRVRVEGLMTEQQVLEYLDELQFLAETAGAVTVKKFYQKLAHPDSKTFVGKGKLQEIKQRLN